MTDIFDRAEGTRDIFDEAAEPQVPVHVPLMSAHAKPTIDLTSKAPNLPPPASQEAPGAAEGVSFAPSPLPVIDLTSAGQQKGQAPHFKPGERMTEPLQPKDYTFTPNASMGPAPEQSKLGQMWESFTKPWGASRQEIEGALKGKAEQLAAGVSTVADFLVKAGYIKPAEFAEKISGNKNPALEVIKDVFEKPKEYWDQAAKKTMQNASEWAEAGKQVPEGLAPEFAAETLKAAAITAPDLAIAYATGGAIPPGPGILRSQLMRGMLANIATESVRPGQTVEEYTKEVFTKSIPLFILHYGGQGVGPLTATSKLGKAAQAITKNAATMEAGTLAGNVLTGQTQDRQGLLSTIASSLPFAGMEYFGTRGRPPVGKKRIIDAENMKFDEVPAGKPGAAEPFTKEKIDEINKGVEEIKAEEDKGETLFRGTTPEEWESVKAGGRLADGNAETVGNGNPQELGWFTTSRESADAYSHGVVIELKPEASGRSVRLTDDPGDQRRQGSFNLDDVARVYDANGKVVWDASEAKIEGRKVAASAGGSGAANTFGEVNTADYEVIGIYRDSYTGIDGTTFDRAILRNKKTGEIVYADDRELVKQAEFLSDDPSYDGIAPQFKGQANPETDQGAMEEVKAEPTTPEPTIRIPELWERTKEGSKEGYEDANYTGHYIDGQTGFHNRHAWDVLYADRIKQGSRVGTFDLNNLKPTNTEYGHAGGDVLIGGLAKACKASGLHSEDQPVFRTGGDEFAVFFKPGEDPTISEAKMAKAKEIFAQMPLTIKGADGIIKIIKGGSFEYGTGRTIEEADAPIEALKKARRDRLKGGEPGGLSEQPPGGIPDNLNGTPEGPPSANRLAPVPVGKRPGIDPRQDIFDEAQPEKPLTEKAGQEQPPPADQQLAKEAGAPPVSAKPSEKTDTIAGKMDLGEFEDKGYSPEEVTRQDWVNMQRAERRRLGQQEGGDNPRDPWVEYEEHHRDAVKRAIAKGVKVDDRVLKDYPDLKPKGRPPVGNRPKQPEAEKIVRDEDRLPEGPNFRPGDDVTVKDGSGGEFKGRWVIVDASLIDRSPEFQNRTIKNAGHERVTAGTGNDFDPRDITADTGFGQNGPSIMLEDGRLIGGFGRDSAWTWIKKNNPEKYEELMRILKKRLPQYGLSEADLEGIEDPRLVRVVKEPATRKELMDFVHNLNKTLQAPMDVAAKAVADASQISDADIADFVINEDQSLDAALISARNAAAVQRVFGRILSRAEQISMRDTKSGTWDAAAKTRIENAFIAKVFGSEKEAPLLNSILASADTDVKNLKGAIMSAAGELLRARSEMGKSEIEGDIFGPLGEALNAYINLKQTYSAKDFSAEMQLFLRIQRERAAGHGALFGEEQVKSEALSPESLQILEYLNKNATKKSALTNFLKAIARGIISAPGKGAGTNIFGESIVAKSSDIIEEALKMTGAKGELKDLPVDSSHFDDSPGAPSGKASVGKYNIKRALFRLPEIVRIARDLGAGKYPEVLKRIGRNPQVGGRFLELGQGKVLLKAEIFKDPGQAEATLAHEIGHWVDYLPEKTSKRGNILGRIASLKGYMKHYLEEYPGSPNKPLTPEDRKRLWKEIRSRAVGGKKIADQVIIEEVTREVPKWEVVGVTPEMILDIMRGITKLPEDIYHYLQSADSAEKKSIVKQALKGVVAENIGKLGVRTQVGTETITETVTMTLREALKKAIKDEIIKRKLFRKEIVTQELKALSKEWRPWDETKADAEFKKYRDSSSELYADAVSVLLNDPDMLKEKAPVFFQAFENFLERKPEFAKTFTDIQDEILNGTADKAHWDDVDRMFKMADAKASMELKKEPDPHGINTVWTNLSAALFKTHAPIMKIENEGIKEGIIKSEDRPSLTIEEMFYAGAQLNQYMEDMSNRFMDGLKKVGISYSQARQYMYALRVANERSEIANPLGTTPAIAKERLKELEGMWGPERFKEFERLRGEFNKTHKEVLEAGHDIGLFTEDLYEHMKDNDYYVTFSLQDYMDAKHGAGTSAHVFQQIGTLKEIEDPIAATMLKDLSILRAAARNRAARETIDMMKKVSPDLIKPADTQWNGKFNQIAPPKDSSLKLLVVMEKGKPAGYYVPKSIADTFESNPLTAWFITRWSKNLANPFRAVFTQYNPGFWLFNLIRDYQATVKKTPGMTLLLPGPVGDRTPLWLWYLKAMKDTSDLVEGKSNDIIRQMRKAGALISVESMRDLDPEDMKVERLLKRWQINTGEKRAAWKEIARFFEHVDKAGNFIESWAKVATWKYLAEKRPDMPVSERAHHVRTQAGSPAFLIKGKVTPLLNNIAIYSNAMFRGWDADFEAIKKDPVQYTWTTAKLAIAPTILLGAAAYGLLGDKQKKMIDNVGEYDKTNYNIIPLGMTKTGKTVYIRIPRDELSRFVGGILWKSMNYKKAGKLAQTVDFTQGQMPGFTPYIGTAADLFQYASGKNPYDSFRGKTAIPEKVFEAGGWRAAEALMKYEANNLGASVVYQFETDDVNKIKSDLEKLLKFPVASNIIGRFIKVSSQGQAESISEAGKAARKEEAGRRLEVKDRIVASINKGGGSTEEISRLYGELRSEKMIPETQSPKQFRNMYVRYLAKREGDPRIESFIYAGSNAEKKAMLEYFKGAMQKEEFEDLERSLLDMGLVSEKIIQ